MFEHLAEYRRIIVTGPQRAGTRIASAMITNDTDHYHVDERLVGIDCLNQFCAIVYPDHQPVPLVIQCPGFSPWVHNLPELDEMLIVWMVRPVAEIEASEKRIGLRHGYIERIKYPREFQQQYDSLSVMKYAFFAQYQREHIPNLLELDYHSLRDHPFWVPKSERGGWESNRIANDDSPIDFNRIVVEWSNAV